MLLVAVIGDQPIDRLDARRDEVDGCERRQRLPAEVIAIGPLHGNVLDEVNIFIQQLRQLAHRRENVQRELVHEEHNARRLTRKAADHVIE